MASLDSCIPLPLDKEVLKDVVTKAKDWAIMHGAAMRSKDSFSEDSLVVLCYLILLILNFIIKKKKSNFSFFSL